MTVYGTVFIFFRETASTEIYTLSLHDALPISRLWFTVYEGDSEVPPDEDAERLWEKVGAPRERILRFGRKDKDRKSTRLNSSHSQISYAVFCLKKKRHACQGENINFLRHAALA